MVIELIPDQSIETILSFIKCMEEISLQTGYFDIKLCLFVSSQSLSNINHLLYADDHIKINFAKIYYQLPSDNYDFIRHVYKSIVESNLTSNYFMKSMDDDSTKPIIDFTKIVFWNHNFVLKIGSQCNKVKIINYDYQFPHAFEKLLTTTRTKIGKNHKNEYSLINPTIMQILNSYSNNNTGDCLIKVNHNEIFEKITILREYFEFIEKIRICQVHFFSNINLSVLDLNNIKFPIYWSDISFNGYNASINLSNLEVTYRGNCESSSLWRELAMQGFTINFQH